MRFSFCVFSFFIKVLMNKIEKFGRWIGVQFQAQRSVEKCIKPIAAEWIAKAEVFCERPVSQEN